MISLKKPFTSETAKGGFWSVVDQCISSATIFLMGLFLARYCSVNEYGLYVLAFSLILFWESIRLSLISSPFIVHLTREPAEMRPSYAGSQTVLNLLLTLIGAGILGGVAISLYLFYRSPLSVTLLASAFALIGFSFSEYTRRLFHALLRFRNAVYITFLSAVLQLGGVIVLYLLGHLSTVNVFIIIAIAQFISAFIGFLLLSGNISFHRMNLRHALKNNIAYGKFLTIANGLTVFNIAVLPWLLEFTKGRNAVAIYGACYMIASLWKPFIQGFSNFIFPKLSHTYSSSDVKKLKSIVRVSQVYLFFMTALVSIGLIVFAEKLLMLAYQEKYAGNGSVIIILAIQALISSVLMPLTSATIVLGRPDTGVYSSIMITAMTFTIGVGMIFWLGSAGAAIIMVLAYAIHLLVFGLIYTKEIAKLGKGNA